MIKLLVDSQPTLAQASSYLCSLGLVAITALAATGGVVVSAVGGGGDQPITGPALAECTAAALAEHPGGTVTDTEVGDDGAAYGVEIRLEDGSEVEVHLNETVKSSAKRLTTTALTK